MEVWPLDRDEVDLWTSSLSTSHDDLLRAQELLDDVERRRFERVIRPVQRDRLIMARAALRRILASYLGIEPRQVSFTRDAGGKPALAAHPRLAFNLSHSGTLAVVAVTHRASVGVDIEMLGRRLGPGVVRRALSQAELALVLSRPRAEQTEAFLRHWTAKEAYAKALGVGLAVGMDSVEIADGLDEPALAGAKARNRWSLQTFAPAPGAVGAVVARGGPFRTRLRTQ